MFYEVIGLLVKGALIGFHFVKTLLNNSRLHIVARFATVQAVVLINYISWPGGFCCVLSINTRMDLLYPGLAQANISAVRTFCSSG